MKRKIKSVFFSQKSLQRQIKHDVAIEFVIIAVAVAFIKSDKFNLVSVRYGEQVYESALERERLKKKLVDMHVLNGGA